MTHVTPYLLFDGTCREAMEFYHACLGGQLNMTQVKDSPARDSMPATQHEKILNAHLKSGTIEISASDWLRPDRSPLRGNTVCLFLREETDEALRARFEQLSEGADVTDPLKKVFFGTYGALNDRFGIRWMFHSNL